MAAFLARLWRDVLGQPCPSEPAHTFTDTAGSFAAADIACIYALGVTKGTTSTAYAPEGTLTAAQVTLFTTRLLNRAKPGACTLTDSGLRQAAACLTSHNIAPGAAEAEAEAPAPRAQMAVYLIGAWHSITKGNPPKPPAAQEQPPRTQLPKFTAIAAGDDYSCGIRVNETIVCWGHHLGGQADAPQGGFTAITAGWAHSCGIRADRTAVCWGDNFHGQADAPQPPGGFTAITAGRAHTCAIRADGTAVCWGSNDYGQADAPQPPGGFTAITAGRAHTCAIRADGTAVCWGAGSRFVMF